MHIVFPRIWRNLLIAIAFAQVAAPGVFAQESSHHLNNVGVKAINSEDYPKAVESLESALRLDPDYELAKFNLFLGFKNYGLKLENDPEKAIRMFHKALLFNPQDYDVIQNLDKAVKKTGKNPYSFEDRIGIAKKLSDAGSSGEAFVEYGQALRIREDKDARQELNKTFAQATADPNDFEFKLHRRRGRR
jgi:tetratricopeptide (TPR) repeat protein